MSAHFPQTLIAMRLDKVTVKLFAIVNPLSSQRLECIRFVRIVFTKETHSHLRCILVIVLLFDIFASENFLVLVSYILSWIAHKWL